tara:strand:+ start:225 stop:473 length:249 start_codon:yes stop_codon:yes gene_type:complete
MVDEIKDDVYTSKGREAEVAEDVIEDWEAGVVKGFEEGARDVECSNCHQVLVENDIVELKLADKEYKFCCNDCAEEFKRKNI